MRILPSIQRKKLNWQFHSYIKMCMKMSKLHFSIYKIRRKRKLQRQNKSIFFIDLHDGSALFWYIKNTFFSQTINTKAKMDWSLVILPLEQLANLNLLEIIRNYVNYGYTKTLHKGLKLLLFRRLFIGVYPEGKYKSKPWKRTN